MKIQIPDAFAPLFDPKRYKLYWGGRGAGKSHSFAITLLIMGLQRCLRVLCAREIQLSIKDSVKRVLDDKIKKFPIFKNFYTSTRESISGKNDSLFIFAGLRHNIESIKSNEGIDICWVEEADTVSKTSLKILFPTIRKDNSEIWFSFNPRRKDAPVFNDFVVENMYPESLAYVRKINFDENPFFPEVLERERQWCKKHDPEQYRHVWEGHPLQLSAASVFVGKYKIDRFEAPKDAFFYFGADWGFSVDPTVLIRCYVDDVNRQLFIDYEAYQVGCEIDDTPALFDTIPESRKWLITADSARPETISHMQRKGFNIVPSKKGSGSVEDGIEFIRSYTTIIHERCTHVRDEWSLYSYKIDQRTEQILPVVEDKNNHCVDAARYAIEKFTAGSPSSYIIGLS
jgi:phage terminase large subunit